jgi:predicted kinase
MRRRLLRSYRRAIARLILLNGPPASGKSTLAATFAAAHPLSLNLDIDVVRSLIGRWADFPADAGLLARRAALAMARACLNEHHDVIVPQLVARATFITQLEEVALRAPPSSRSR